MKIVVATDGSRGGIAAVRFAGRLATGDPGARLVVLTIGGQAGHRDSAAGPRRGDDVLGAAARELQKLELTKRCEFVSLRTRNDIPEAISTFCGRARADLIVIGSEGRDTLQEWVVGGVALRLLYIATRPVVVVRPARPRRSLASGARGAGAPKSA